MKLRNYALMFWWTSALSLFTAPMSFAQSVQALKTLLGEGQTA